jgi:hypothetical protein
MNFLPEGSFPSSSRFWRGRLLPNPVINEIMFHPAGTPEPLGEEWIEVLNPDAALVNLSGCKFTDGINFTIPNGTIVPAGGYLVVAANVAVFNASHPGFSGMVVGGWSGRLSNSGENIRFETSLGIVIDEVRYAMKAIGLPARGPLLFGHRGWIWVCNADGTGRTFELRNCSVEPQLRTELGREPGRRRDARGGEFD